MDDLEKFIDTVRRKYHLPALAVAVHQEGRPDIVAVSGIRNANEPDNPVAKDDQFHFGSCGKSVTAAIIHKLVEKKQLRLDETLAEIFPDVKLHPKYANVTIADILTHSAGFPEMPAEIKKWPDEPTLGAASGLEAMKEKLTQPPKYERGNYTYSNFGYVLLGHIAEQISGKNFETLAREEIFEPLGMKSAGFKYGLPAKETAPLGHRHKKDAKGQVTRDLEPVRERDDGFPKEFEPAGLMHASVSDWLKFMTYEMKQDRVLHPLHAVAVPNEEVGRLYTDSAFNQYKDGTFAHDGSNALNKARQVLMPGRNAAFVIVTTDVGMPVEVGGKMIESTTAALNEVSQYVKEHVIQPAINHTRAAGKIGPETSYTLNGSSSYPSLLSSLIETLQQNGLLVKLSADPGQHDQTTLEIPVISSAIRPPDKSRKPEDMPLRPR